MEERKHFKNIKVYYVCISSHLNETRFTFQKLQKLSFLVLNFLVLELKLINNSYKPLLKYSIIRMKNESENLKWHNLIT